MPKKAWNGRGVLSEGVDVKFTSRVGTIRRIKRPHPWPSPAAELKREEAERARAEAGETPDEERSENE